MSHEILRATIFLEDKPLNLDNIYLIFTKTDKRITKRNYIDSAEFPSLVKRNGVWTSTIIPSNPLGVITTIKDKYYSRVEFYPKPEQPYIVTLTLTINSL